MNGTKVAYRYAKSLLDVAQDQKILDKVYNDMVLVRKTIVDNPDFAEYVSSPVVKTANKIEIAKKVFGEKIEKLSLDFLNLIASNGREEVYLEIVKRFIHLYDEVKGVEVAKVISAIKLDKKLLSRIQKHVSALTGKDIDIVEELDKDIIGGYILKIGDYQYDASILNNVQKLQREFKENLYDPKL
jgi:F-type H+-transporting ATPase subunit delta